jgi:MFS transporter, SHS family, lactate transporter
VRSKQPRPSIGRVLQQDVGLTVYAVVMMTACKLFSHGTQDRYPNFLQVQHHLSPQTVAAIAVAYNIAAMLAGPGFGWLSQVIGCQRAIVIGALLALPCIPLWAYGTTPMWLGAGAVMMQLCVQGAWGVIPAHLNELSPPDIRGSFPGVTYQPGNLLAAAKATIQTTLADSMDHNFAPVLAGTVAIVAVVIAVVAGYGYEARHARMGAGAGAAAE